MQTFLPEPNIWDSARVLDMKRLGKQRVETKQILRALQGLTKGWTNHPATRMWRGHEGLLCTYGIAICTEWRIRGYNDTLLEYFQRESRGYETTLPSWWNDPRVHDSHKANLIRKDYHHYVRFWPDILPQEGYYWPV